MSSQNQEIVYVYPETGVEFDGRAIYDQKAKMSVKYLNLKGKYQIDPVPGGSSQYRLYSDLDADGTIDKASLVPNRPNFPIVPASYDIRDANQFASEIRRAGPIESLREMKAAFGLRGKQDIQRGKIWGIPDGGTDPAVDDAASWNLGHVTRVAKIPIDIAILEARKLNIEEFVRNIFGSIKNHHAIHLKLPSGPFGMEPADYKNFIAGVRAARASLKNSRGRKTMRLTGPMAPMRIRPRFPLRVPHKPAAGQNHGASLAPANTRRVLQPWMPAFRPKASKTPSKPSSFGGAAGFAQAAASFRASAGHSILPRSGNVAPWHSPRRTTARSVKPAALLPAAARPRAVLDAAHPSSEKGMGDVMMAWPRDKQMTAHVSARKYRRMTLPSVAPVRRMQWPEHPTSSSGTETTSPPGQVAARVPRASPVVMSGENMAAATPAARTNDAELSRALRELLDRQGRLPPSGATGFDPRLTPAWAGQKLPF